MEPSRTSQNLTGRAVPAGSGLVGLEASLRPCRSFIESLQSKALIITNSIRQLLHSDSDPSTPKPCALSPAKPETSLHRLHDHAF